MAQVRQTDKRTGIVYVYETEAVWDPERKQTRYGKRTLIGHIDHETGELVPNRPKRASATTASSRRAFFGTRALLNEAARESGLKNALVDAMGERTDDVLAIAGYLVSEAPMPLSRLPRWMALHDIPAGGPLDARRCSELLASIGDSERDALCAPLMRAGGGSEFFLYEVAPIASYEQVRAWSRHGADCSLASLPRVNLAVVVDRASGMPLCYRRLRGSVAAADELLASMGLSDMGAVCLALDYGLWSTSDIDAMLKARQPFIVELPPSNDSSEDILARYRGVLGAGETGDVVGDVRGIRIACVWSHGQMVPHVGDAAGEGYSGYAYLLFDPSRRADEKNSGYRILFSNEVMEPADVFAIYQGKHVVEKRFENMEGLLDLHEPSLSYERMLPGGLFVAFVALALAAWLQKRMREAGLDGEYTLRELLDEVETIERFTQEGRAARIGKLTSRQRALFTKLGYSLSDE